MTGFTRSTGTVPYLHHAGITRRARHGFFGTAGGVSNGVYASLNCGFGSSDAPELVAQNRDHVCAAMGLAPHRMAAVYQVHGREVVIAEDLFDDAGMLVDRASLPRADGLVTTTPGLGLSILTADCLPLLLVDAKGHVAGACHAGWRGAAAGIVAGTVALMRDKGAGKISAMIGPTIRQRSYQVGAEMRRELLDSVSPAILEAATGCFDPDGKDHYRFDLPRLVRCQLAADGVEDILDCGIDTYRALDTGSDARPGSDPGSDSGSDPDSDPDSGAYFSHRRATHAGEADCGRQIAVISLAG